MYVSQLSELALQWVRRTDMGDILPGPGAPSAVLQYLRTGGRPDVWTRHGTWDKNMGIVWI